MTKTLSDIELQKWMENTARWLTRSQRNANQLNQNSFFYISKNLRNVQSDYKALYSQISLVLLQIGRGIYTHSSTSRFPPYQQASAVQELSTKKEKTVNEQLQLELHTTRRNIYEPRPSGILSTCGYVMIPHLRILLNIHCIAGILLEEQMNFDDHDAKSLMHVFSVSAKML